MELKKAKVAAQKKAESAGKNFEWGYPQQKKVVENVIRQEKIKHKKGSQVEHKCPDPILLILYSLIASPIVFDIS